MSLYKHHFLNSAGGFLGRSKNQFFKEKKKNLGRLLQNQKRKEGKFSSFSIFIRTKPNPNQKQSFFFFFFSFENSNLSLTRVWNLNFQDKITIKTVNTLWREINTASTSFSTPFFIIFFVLFNFLFDSIYFYFCVDYLLIIFLLFLIFWWVEWCKSMVEMHKDPWYAMG